jgi:hypothetical protein
MGAPMNIATVTDRLCARYGVVSDRDRSALLSRTKQLQRMGWPKSTKVGRGSRDNWSEEAYADLLIVTELRTLGLPAQTALEIATANLKSLRSAYKKRGQLEIAHSAFDHQRHRSRILLDFAD